MLLALSVISPQGASMGAGAYKVFDERGGSIGRIAGNDWALPDQEKFVSSRHALIRFAGGTFSLEDVSTNGTFINALDRPAPKNAPARLADGDRIYIGDYEILVQLIEEPAPAAEAAPAPDRAPPPPLAAPAQAPPPAAAVLAAAPPPAPEGLNTADPLAVIGVKAAAASAPPPAPSSAPPRVAGSGAFIPEDAMLTLLPPEHRQAAPPPRPAPVAVPSNVPASARAQPIAQPQPLAASAAPAGATAGSSAPSGLQQLFAALGIDAREIDPELAAQLGAIIRTVVQGMVDVLRARAEVKNNFRMPMTSIRAIENNPLKFSLNAEDALHNLFVKRNPGYLGPIEAFHEGFQDIAFHELAVLAGIRAAYQAMLAKFNPAQLEEAYNRRLRRTAVINIASRLKFWDMYCAQFEDIEKDAEANFQLLFGEEFAKAYHEQFNKLAQAARLNKR